MRRFSFALLFAVFLPAVATAQTAPPPPVTAAPGAAAPAPAAAAPMSGRRARGGDVTRDEYVERAVERARRAAEARFDRMDADHNGVLTAEERRAARAARRGGAQ